MFLSFDNAFNHPDLGWIRHSLCSLLWGFWKGAADQRSFQVTGGPIQIIPLLLSFPHSSFPAHKWLITAVMNLQTKYAWMWPGRRPTCVRLNLQSVADSGLLRPLQRWTSSAEFILIRISLISNYLMRQRVWTEQLSVALFLSSDKSWMHTPEALAKHYIAYNVKVRKESPSDCGIL